MAQVFRGLPAILFLLLMAAFSFADDPDIPVVNTGDVYSIGDDIPVIVSTQADTLDYKLEWVLVDRTSIIGETYEGTGTVRSVEGLGRVAFLPTSVLTKKGVYYLSASGIPRHRILLVDPVPTITDPLTWPFGDEHCQAYGPGSLR